LLGATTGCDVSDIHSQFPEKLKGNSVDLLLNIAGIMAPNAQDGLGSVSESALSRSFVVNTYGPLLLTQALLPNLLQSSEPRLASVSGRVGSIAGNSTGGSYGYRAKAVLNSICKSIAVELKGNGAVVIVMHPGFVKATSRH
jgi:NAD(P)-dependent dehydrogenase (short-subunit alcohol dehydrogenase family)